MNHRRHIKDLQAKFRKMSVDQIEHMIEQIQHEIDNYAIVSKNYSEADRIRFSVPYVNSLHDKIRLGRMFISEKTKIDC